MQLWNIRNIAYFWVQHFEFLQWPILLAAVVWPLKPIQAKPLIPDLNMKYENFFRQRVKHCCNGMVIIQTKPRGFTT